ncbi:pilus assembly protein TadG-related protein [Paenarthrobacter nicotinovorans]|uniref:pilus assembly protein TadG-related protein n=1 Tax=Paenarthrobacter nicotinovorans TaxID=29320 RepID=UPI00119F6FDC|nr:pilus assembly protein TadG-related protein [Paenarthrobacter nicotinovorans]
MSAQPTRSEQGETTLTFIVMVVVVLAAVLLVVDGGRKVSGQESAQFIAGEAARVGAGRINPDTLYGNRPAVDPYAARNAALQYLSAQGATGTVSVTGNTITVTATKKIDFIFFPGPATVTGTATVEPEHRVGN